MTRTVDHVYRDHYSLLCRVVTRSGVPRGSVEDVVSEIVTRMLAQDGLGKFDWTQPEKLPAYLASYFSLASRAWLTRILTHRQRCVPLEGVGDLQAPELSEEDFSYLDELMRQVADEDGRSFILASFQTLSYHDARQLLLDQGWDPARVALAVRRARAGIRKAAACTT